MSAKEDWRAVQEDVKEHRGAWKRVMWWALAGCLIMMLATLGFCTKVLGGIIPNAKAVTVNVDCPAGSTWTWTAATSTVSCVAGSTPPIPPDPPVTQCPAGSLVIKGQWGKTGIETSNTAIGGGDFKNNYLAVEVKVPTTFSGSSVRSTSWVEYGAGSVVRYAVFSKNPCDFTTANALRNQYGALVSTNQIRFSFTYNATGGGTAAKLTPGTTYWINIKNTFQDNSPSCSIDNCSMRGQIDG